MNTSLITIHQEIDIDAPTADVWRVVADYGRDPQWRTGVLSMVPSPPGPVTAGTTTVEELRLGGRLWRNEGEVTAVEPGRRFEWRTTSGAVARGSRSVEALGAGRSRLRLELHVTPTGTSRLMIPVLGRMLRRNLARDVRRLAEVVEAVPTAAPATR